MSQLRKTNYDDLAQTIWQNAQLHKTTYHISIPELQSKIQTSKCDCCEVKMDKKVFDLKIHIKKLEVFGHGYPLYFSFLKYCIVLILVLIVSRTGVSTYMAIKENYKFCTEDTPSSNKTKSHHQTVYAQHQQEHLSLRRYNDSNGNSTNLKLNQNLVPQDFYQSQQNNIKKSHYQVEENKQAQLDQKDYYHHESKIECEGASYLIYMSIFKGQYEYNNIFSRFVGFIIHLVALIGIKSIMIQQEQYYDLRNRSLSDYSIMVSNLPQVDGVGGMVKKFFKDEFGKTTEVKQIIYNLKKTQKLQQQQKKLKQYQQQLINAANSKDKNKFQEMKKQIQEKQQKIKLQCNKLQGNINEDKAHCQKLIIVMNTQKDKKDILENFQQNESSKKQQYFQKYFKSPELQTDKKYYVQLSQASQPSQIIWENLDESSFTRYGLIIRSWIFTFIFLALIISMFYLFLRWKRNYVQSIQEKNHDDNSAYHIVTFIIIGVLCVVVLFNKFIMNLILQKIVHMERHAYTYREGFSFTLKYSLGMFFTTAVMTLIIQGIVFKNFYTHPYGVIEQQSFMFFVTAFFIPLVWLIHPYNLYKQLKHQLKKGTPVAQDEANELIKDFEFDLEKKHAQIFGIIWFTFFYSELIPMGSFLILIGLVMYYWVDKFNLLRRQVIEKINSVKKSTFSLKGLDATLFLAHAGRVIFTFFVQDHKINHFDTFLTIIGIIYLFLPTEYLVKVLGKMINDKKKQCSKCINGYIENKKKQQKITDNEFDQKKIQQIQMTNQQKEKIDEEKRKIYQQKNKYDNVKDKFKDDHYFTFQPVYKLIKKYQKVIQKKVIIQKGSVVVGHKKDSEDEAKPSSGSPEEKQCEMCTCQKQSACLKHKKINQCWQSCIWLRSKCIPSKDKILCEKHKSIYKKDKKNKN